MITKLLVIIIAIAFDSRFLDGSVHSLDLLIRPWMVNFGEAMFNPVFSAPHQVLAELSPHLVAQTQTLMSGQWQQTGIVYLQRFALPQYRYESNQSGSF